MCVCFVLLFLLVWPVVWFGVVFGVLVCPWFIVGVTFVFLCVCVAIVCLDWPQLCLCLVWPVRCVLRQFVCVCGLLCLAWSLVVVGVISFLHWCGMHFVSVWSLFLFGVVIVWFVWPLFV